MISDLAQRGVRAMGPSRGIGQGVRGGADVVGLRLGLTSYWKMNEASNVTRVDSMGTSNLSDVNSNTAQSVTALLGGLAATFVPLNATRVLRVTTAAPYSGGASFTLSGWMAWAQTNSTPLIAKWGVANEYVLFDPGTGNLVWEAVEAGTLITRSLTFLPPASGVQVYWTLGYDDTAKQLFVYANAVSKGTAACNGINPTTELLAFGNYSNPTVGDQSSNFQDWGFWRRVLSATEIASLYNAGAGKAFATF